MYQAYAQKLLNQKDAETDADMQDSTIHPLVLATKRLVTALDRLEDNLQKVVVEQQNGLNQAKELVSFEKENASLRKERENLNVAISQLQFEYDDLHGVANTIYNKLDDSIKRLTQIIEG